jgi:hypothetical protein
MFKTTDVETVMKKAYKIQKEFYESSRFREVLEQIKIEVELYGQTSDRPSKRVLFGDVTNEEFVLVFHCLFNESLSGLSTEEHGGNTHWQEHLVYEEVEFIEIYSHGSAFVARRMQ